MQSNRQTPLAAEAPRRESRMRGGNRKPIQEGEGHYAGNQRDNVIADAREKDVVQIVKCTHRKRSSI